jgi:hypothetical protein
MPIFGVAINDDGEVLNFRKAPHQADDCDGLVYKATDKDGKDIYLFLINAMSKGEAVINAQQTFNDGEFVALDPIWQPGSMWPDTADEGMDEQAAVQLYSPQMGRGYITTVPTHRRTDPFIDHFGEKIMWAYMRDIEARLMIELTEGNERTRRMNEQRRQQTEVPIEREAVTEPIQAKQLSFDFG